MEAPDIFFIVLKETEKPELEKGPLKKKKSKEEVGQSIRGEERLQHVCSEGGVSAR